MPSTTKRPGSGRASAGNGTTAATATTTATASDAATPTPAASPEQARPAPQPAPQPAPPPQPAAGQQRLNITDLKDMSIQKLTQIAKDLAVGGATGMRKQELIFQILKAQTELSGFIFSEGVLEVLPD